MSDFTIVKFDFKDYFNSVSAIYVYERFLKTKILDRFERDIIKDFTDKTRYTYAGLNTSNAMAEIAAKHFDQAVKQAFSNNGVIFYERYIDDSVLILNEYIEKQEIKKKLNTVLLSVFQDSSIQSVVKCKTRFNNNKFKYISSRELSGSKVSFDYLGYEFFLRLDGNDVRVTYGITKEKQEKYNRRFDKMISCYTDLNNPDYGDLELLRHRILAFTSRTVYLSKNIAPAFGW